MEIVRKMNRSGMFMHYTHAFLMILFLTSDKFHTCACQSYVEDCNNLFDDVFYSNKYDKDVIPKINASSPVLIIPIFDLVSIGIDDVAQKMYVNGIMGFLWNDHRLAWEQEKYGNISVIYKSTSDVWLPGVQLMNTAGKGNVFKTEDNAHVIVSNDGSVNWPPGSEISFSCNLDLTKYPFDEQLCTLTLALLSYSTDTKFSLEHGSRIDKDSFYDKNEEWHLDTAYLTEGILRAWGTSSLHIHFLLRRRPTFVILNIILPVILLAFLNVLTFLIPVSSGQRISYAVTMLLSLTVFLSIVSDRIPHSADNIPHVTIYTCV